MLENNDQSIRPWAWWVNKRLTVSNSGKWSNNYNLFYKKSSVLLQISVFQLNQNMAEAGRCLKQNHKFYVYFENLFVDPLGRPKVAAKSDNYFHTSHFSKSLKQNYCKKTHVRYRWDM